MPKCVLLVFVCLAFVPYTLCAEPPSPPSYGVRIENAWIPMKDGIRLAATLYMPDGAKASDKFPGILEYQPYRKDDAMAARDYAL